MNKTPKKISDSVLNQIKNGDVKMRSKTYFTLLSALIVFAGIFAGILTSFLSSVVFFWLRVVTSESAAYGARRNLAELASTFPWWALFASTAIVFGITFLVRRYGNLYRYKTGNIIAAVLLVALVFGAGLSTLGFGDYRHSGQNFQQKHQNGPRWNN